MNLYDELFTVCVNNWKLISVKEKSMKGLSCVLRHFFNDKTKRNLSFFLVNSVIIGVAGDYCEDVSIFGEEW